MKLKKSLAVLCAVSLLGFDSSGWRRQAPDEGLPNRPPEFSLNAWSDVKQAAALAGAYMMIVGGGYGFLGAEWLPGAAAIDSMPLPPPVKTGMTTALGAAAGAVAGIATGSGIGLACYATFKAGQGLAQKMAGK